MQLTQKVVSQITQSPPSLCFGQANSSCHFGAHRGCDYPEDVLNPCPCARSCLVVILGFFAQGMAPRTLLLNSVLKASFFH